MEETVVKSTESLLNYGAVGILALMCLSGLIWTVRHILSREKHHEAKYETHKNEILKVYNEQTKITTEFNNTVNNFKASQDDHTQVIRDLTNLIHSK
jgi:hypothetical protein